MSKTTVKTLRYYDKVGILKPEMIAEFTNYRSYSTAQLMTLQEIQAYRQIGLTIEEIKTILAGAAARPLLLKRQAEIKAELTVSQTKLAVLHFILNRDQEKEKMNYCAVIKEVAECVVYYKQLILPNYDAYFEVIPEIGEQVAKQYPQLRCAVPEYCFVIYRDREYKEQDIKVEFCEAVDKLWPDFVDIKFRKMPAIRVVSVLHQGPYQELGQAYAYAMSWITDNGYTVADNPRESYIDGIWNKDDPADWLTEVQIPISR